MNEDKAERVIRILDRIDKEFKELRKELADNLPFKEPPKQTRQPRARQPKQEEEDIFILEFDDSQIEFKQKDGVKAGPYASWGWAFGLTQEGDYHEESRTLVQAIEQYGKVQVGNREYELKGREGNLLNFKKIKKEK